MVALGRLTAVIVLCMHKMVAEARGSDSVKCLPCLSSIHSFYTWVSQVPTLSVIHSFIIYTEVGQVHTLSVNHSLILYTEVRQVPTLSFIHSLTLTLTLNNMF